MKMIKTILEYPPERFVKGEVTIKFKAYLPFGDEREEIEEEEALFILKDYLEMMAGSNDGSELLLNAKPKIIE